MRGSWHIKVGPTTIDRILRLVAIEFCVSIREMKSRTRRRSMVVARQAAIWMARELTALSTPVLGRIFADRDHTTILSAIAVNERRMREDQEFCHRVAHLLLEAQRPPLNERASAKERTAMTERATEDESTIQRERAIVDERTIQRERATGVERTNTTERAMCTEST